MVIYYADQVRTGSLTATIASLETTATPVTVNGVKVSGGWKFALPGTLVAGVYSVRYTGSGVDAYDVVDTNAVLSDGTVNLTPLLDLLKADEIRDGNLYQKRLAGTTTVLVQKTRTTVGNRVELKQ